MIDISKILEKLYVAGARNITGKAPLYSRKEALTAIYEIGLEVIGEDEIHEHAKFCNSPCDDYTEETRNELRASQRKAWAKACGVAE